MVEIESKFKLSADVTREQLMSMLQDQFIAPVSCKRQIDTVFLLPEQINSPIAPGSKILRIREVLDPKTGKLMQSVMTLKVEGQTKLASDEYEVAVSDGDMARQMLAALGWQKTVMVDKVRAESRTHEYTVCIDEVVGLGLFIELEVLIEDNTQAGDIQQRMHTFLNGLGVRGQLWEIPYDTSIKQASCTQG